MLRSIVKRFASMIALYAAIGVACAVLSALSVYYFQQLVDALPTRGGFETIGRLVLLYGLTWALVVALNYIEEYPHNQLYHGIREHIRQMALGKVSTIAYTAYQDIGTGTLVQRIENGASAGRDILFDFYLAIFTRSLPSAALSIALMGVYDAGIMLAALSGYLAVFVITRLLLKRLYAIKEKTLVEEEWLSKTYVRAFMELVVFRAGRRFAHELSQVRRISRQVVKAHTRIKMVHEFFFASFAMIVLLIKLALLAANAGRVMEGSLSIGVLLALLTLIDRVYEPIAIFNVLYVDYKLNSITWRRFSAFLSAPDDPNLLGGKPFVLGKGGICFEDVSFDYGGAEILRGLSLEIPGGKSTALVGPSGGGKSTLVKLAMGLIKPSSGRVLADGQDLLGLDLNSYYRHIAYLSQETPIFDGTLRENICFDQPAESGALRQALELAQLLPLLDRLEDGLDAAVGEHGIKLSGGERQRLAFARVFYQKPAIVILDEPTSALDPACEQRLLEAMRGALAGKTILSVAHREQTLQYADQVYAVEPSGCRLVR